MLRTLHAWLVHILIRVDHELLMQIGHFVDILIMIRSYQCPGHDQGKHVICILLHYILLRSTLDAETFSWPEFCFIFFA